MIEETIREMKAETRNLRRNLEDHIFGGRFRRPFVARLSAALDGIIRIEELLDDLANDRRAA